MVINHQIMTLYRLDTHTKSSPPSQHFPELNNRNFYKFYSWLCVLKPAPLFAYDDWPVSFLLA